MKPNPGTIRWPSQNGWREESFPHVRLLDNGTVQAFGFDDEIGHPTVVLLALGPAVPWEVR